ncbi:MAG: MarR family transcriptional regulator [Thermosediminibacteraceae bacterium]|nr:MarR family transcriptional regulator [Thermosediminibacteraceae bacterium]
MMAKMERDLAESAEHFFRVFTRWLRGILKESEREHWAGIITPAQYRVLFMLNEHGPLKMKHISECMGLSTGNMTIMIDRLVAKGLVERKFSAEDRRVVIVGITPHGKEMLEDAKTNFIEALSKSFTRLSNEDQKRLKSAFETITDIIENKLI